MIKLILSAVLAVAASAASADAAQPTYIHAGRLLADPSTGLVQVRRTIVIEDGIVTRIADGYLTNKDAKTINLEDSFVLPGLIDSHVHLAGDGGENGRLGQVVLSSAQQAMGGVRSAGRVVMAGFTTVADLNSDDDAIFALREATQRGDVVGPRILAAGLAIAAYGGHGDVNGYRREVVLALRSPAVCSGVGDCRRAVREQVQWGADLVKVCVTGGVMSNTAAGLGQQLSNDEIQAIVDTAHHLGRLATAHAHGGDGIKAFLRAGGDSIEHGTFIDAEGIALLKARGGYLIPTLLVGQIIEQEARSPTSNYTPAQKAKALEVGPRMIESARRAHAAGVKMAFGTDTALGTNAREFALLARAGLSPLEAIQAATVNAADHLRISGVAGSLAPGHSADVVAVRGDPLEDVSVLEHVTFVMARGRVLTRQD